MAPAAPLSGFVVLDLGQIYNAPYATLLMALAGADVIKIEPKRGESSRLRYSVKDTGAELPFHMLNSNKRSVTLNLKHDSGRDLLKRMVARADVLIENFRPGVMDRLGVGERVLHEINPELIYASSTGYGREGLYRDLPAMDLTMQAMSGVMSSTGFPDQTPVKAGPALADFFAGIHLYGAVVTALVGRERGGPGRTVDIAMLDSVYPSLMSSLGLLVGRGADAPERTGNHHGGLAVAPYNVYPARDGHLAVICVTDDHWFQLAPAIGHPELAHDPRYEKMADRVANMDEVDAIVGGWTLERSRDKAFELLREAGIPCAPVRRLEEVVDDPHLRERGMVRHVTLDDGREIPVPYTPLRFAGESQPEISPSPKLGEHNTAVYRDWLGLSPAELSKLEEEGAI